MKDSQQCVSAMSGFQLPPGIMLNLGCGPVQPEGWHNVDGSNRAWFATRLSVLDRLLTKLQIFPPTEFSRDKTIYCNLQKKIPVSDGAAAGIYAGELWEHFELADARSVTRACWRALAPGGVLRVCVPDGVEFWRRYLDLFNAEMAKPRADRKVNALEKHIAMYFREICTRRMWLGSLCHKHKWQFDEIQLIALFEDAGFVSVSRMPFQVSRIPHISAVERSDYLIVEGVRP
jgi:predicted SAM-dependent methyltransferase